MGNATSSPASPSVAVAPQPKAAEPLREQQPQNTGTEQNPPEPSWEAALSDPLIFATIWLAVVTSFLALFTYKLWSATISLATDAKASAAEQAEKMERSVAEATKAAIAMESVAASMLKTAELSEATVEIQRSLVKIQKEIAELNMRAYISVVMGDGYFQDRPTGWKFGGKAVVLNGGNTPADRSCFSVNAGILPNPLPADFGLTYGILGASAEGMIPQNQNRTISAFVDDFIPDEEAQSVMSGLGRALYLWGYVTYQDVFEIERRTDFCWSYVFIPKQGGGFTPDCFYTPGRNTAT